MPIELNIGIEPLEEVSRRIRESDEKLVAMSSSSASAKRTVIDNIINSNVDVWQSTAQAMVTAVAGYTDEELVAFVRGTQRQLMEKFGDRVNAFTAERVKEVEAQQEKSTVSETEREAELTNARELREYFKTLKTLLKLQGVDTDSVPDPQSLRGFTSGGKRRSRLEVTYTHFIDGSQRAQSSDNLSSIANGIYPGQEYKGKRTDKLWEYLTNPGPDPDGNPQTPFNRQDPPQNYQVWLPTEPKMKLLEMVAVDSREPVVADDSSDDDDYEEDDDE